VSVHAARPRLLPTVRDAGITVVSGGTDVHLVLVDLRKSALDGAHAEDRLHGIGITVNRNAVPDDRRPPMVTSGLRIGTPPRPPGASARPSSGRSPTSSPRRCSRPTTI
jgi:glycine/serine hydroxymethyltransferase